MKKIRVLLAEDHTILREGLRLLLNDEADIEVVGEAADGRDALEKAENLLPDIVLMDISMPGLNGLEVTRRITKQLSQIKILVLTMHATLEYIFQVLQAGASGYLIKESAATEVIDAIHAIMEGDTYLSPSISRKVIAAYVRQTKTTTAGDRYLQLTNREREILQLIAEGHSNREAAELLHVSIKTVETHRANLMDKLDIHNIAELVKYAIRKGLISLD